MTTDKTSQNETYSYSFDEEVFHGKYASREEAAKAAIQENSQLEAGMKFWTGRNEDPPHASAFLIDVDELIDNMALRAYEECDESAENWPGEYAPEQKAEIERRLGDLADYIQSIDPPKFYLIGDIEEHIVPGASA